MNQKLLMQIGLIDQVTKPLRNITKQIDHTMQTARSGMQDMVTGGAGLVASGFAIQNALMPAIEIDRKIGEVRSLGVTDNALQQLQKTAINFSAAYGKSATEFVDASYDIKSAMGDISGKDLSGITNSSAILAAATKADTKTITSYMGTMYSVFQNQADQMGQTKWAQRVAGMTAKSVEMFKTTGQGMADAFKGLGALAKTNGVTMKEQMAVLGMLQGSMSGSEAGTRYKAFLTGAVKAQKKLKLSFTDSNGHLLSMQNILGKIKNKFGDLNSTEISKLKTAFGSDEAVLLITDLIGKTGQLGTKIQDLDKAANLETAKKMADAMTDRWEQLEASWFAIRAAAFGAILPAINSVVGAVAKGIMYVTQLTGQFPLLTQVLSYAAIAALSFGGVVASLSLVMGFAKLASGGWALSVKLLSGTIKLLSVALKAGRLFTIAWSAAVMIANGEFALMRVMMVGNVRQIWASVTATKAGTIATRVWAATTSFFSSVMAVFRNRIIATTAATLTMSAAGKAAKLVTVGWAAAVGVFNTVLAVFRNSTIAMTAVTWLFNAALWANPVTWIVAGIIALTAAIVAVIYYWDDLKAAFLDSDAFKFIIDSINQLIELLNLIPGVDIEWRAGVNTDNPELKAAENASAVPAADIASRPELKAAQQTKQSVPAMPAVQNQIPLPNVNKLAGVAQHETDDMIDYKSPQNKPRLPDHVVQNMTHQQTQTTKNVRQFGDVYITAPNGITPDQLAEWEILNAG
ncbi:phage tail tape measure protein [Vibrio quintilis]|uniref:Phage-related minor tail protein n=1 Tax=Vibrio quintilis TaxID=1117707 RepID=A0A1M7YZM7_9VIBR|nr:phage tail tape measure protein [Vibrio quintilis]SHO57896.1 Phage-related minor tail protein [Vibrio quintilis]